MTKSWLDNIMKVGPAVQSGNDPFKIVDVNNPESLAAKAASSLKGLTAHPGTVPYVSCLLLALINITNRSTFHYYWRCAVTIAYHGY
jgi:hypothetical protein